MCISREFRDNGEPQGFLQRPPVPLTMANSPLVAVHMAMPAPPSEPVATPPFLAVTVSMQFGPLQDAIAGVRSPEAVADKVLLFALEKASALAVPSLCASAETVESTACAVASASPS